jgi:hypothetical protein
MLLLLVEDLLFHFSHDSENTGVVIRGVRLCAPLNDTCEKSCDKRSGNGNKDDDVFTVEEMMKAIAFLAVAHDVAAFGRTPPPPCFQGCPKPFDYYEMYDILKRCDTECCAWACPAADVQPLCDQLQCPVKQASTLLTTYIL